MASSGVQGVVAVVGVGVGISGHVAKRFASAGYAVALMGRTQEKLSSLASEIQQTAGRARTGTFVVDAASIDSLKQGFAAAKEQLGSIDVLVYNAGPQFRPQSILDIDPEALEAGIRVGCVGALVAAQQVLPDMVARSRGTILFTGATASLRGGSQFAGLAAGKFALRAISQSMAREFGPRGVHVAHIIIDGQVNLPSTRALSWAQGRPDESFLDPSAVAEQYYQLHIQDKTTWTQELELRPFSEKF